MRILYVGIKYDYGDPNRGSSFEHSNLYDTLAHMGHEIIYFDSMTEFQQRGRNAAGKRLVDIARIEKPDLLFCVLFTDQFDVDKIRYISEHTDVVTFNWFCDDHWRFDNYSRYWAPAFNWVSTTASSALPKYQSIGYRNVIKTQWACNHFEYRPLDLPLRYDVSFIGQPHGNRRQTIALLRKAGLDVRTWGHGWDQGRVDQEEMIAIFNQSRVNLNLANASTMSPWHRVRRGLHLSSKATASQIKGRNFEVPGCQALLLTDLADNLDEYFTPEKEVAIFEDPKLLADKVREILQDEPLRRQISEAGYQRTITEHTYELRFNAIFSAMGLG